ncbi:hypothetical protein NMY22_g159 [Coprinellus aureogranulatus]|nr:hypothetical protein NMY22_g159 [Coprinellus aureogranulatus]
MGEQRKPGTGTKWAAAGMTKRADPRFGCSTPIFILSFRILPVDKATFEPGHTAQVNSSNFRFATWALMSAIGVYPRSHGVTDGALELEEDLYYRKVWEYQAHRAQGTTRAFWALLLGAWNAQFPLLEQMYPGREKLTPEEVEAYVKEIPKQRKRLQVWFRSRFPSRRRRQIAATQQVRRNPPSQAASGPVRTASGEPTQTTTPIHQPTSSSQRLRARAPTPYPRISGSNTMSLPPTPITDSREQSTLENTSPEMQRPPTTVQQRGVSPPPNDTSADAVADTSEKRWKNLEDRMDRIEARQGAMAKVVKSHDKTLASMSQASGNLGGPSAESHGLAGSRRT